MKAMSETDVIAHFRTHLEQGLGDLETMLAGLRFRIEHNGDLLDPNYPPAGYRSPKLREYLREVCGAQRTTLWGATALRGRLKLETKGHIITFLEQVNQLPINALEPTLLACGLLYAEKVNADTPAIELPPHSAAQRMLMDALQTGGTVGKIQQGLVFAILHYEAELLPLPVRIETKRTHAGDAQSQRHGDIDVWHSERLAAVFEVKAVVATEALLNPVLASHGQHDYPLYILANGFRPTSLQETLSGLKNTFAVHLLDFMLTKLATVQTLSGAATITCLHQIIHRYNEVFCATIERDLSIRIGIAD